MPEPQSAIASAQVSALNGLTAASGGQCLLDRAGPPCVVVVFGATGDLTFRKLFPSLYDLHCLGSLDSRSCIVGVGRSALDHAAFRERMRESLTQAGVEDLSRWDDLAARLYYCSVDVDTGTGMDALHALCNELDTARQIGGNRLYYLAVPPTAYETIATRLGQAGMASEAQGFARIVIEKPFGSDLVTAKALDAAIHQHFTEHQVFRIDHYLAKETVQNIMVLRFANAIFEPLWDRRYIDHVRITAAESLGVEHRAAFYEQAGVLRDMFQNHMMQLLALCAMEPPSQFEAELVRDEKTKVYRALRPFPVGRLNEHLVLGQYGAGMIDDRKVPAYVDEPGVPADSATPTYACMKVFIDNWRWQGVPFYLVSGKRLRRKHTEIVVKFKEVPYSMFRKVLGEHISANTLILSIQPREEVILTFQTKLPGPMCLRTVRMEFDYNAGVKRPKTDAYVKVLQDVLLGDQTLFWRQDSVELCWGFLTPILQECDCPDKAERLYLYRAGSDGPQEVRHILSPATMQHGTTP
ncbi:glucose-6-phosphate dehydrogenase [Megalodesulfovibrio gigas]|uniref:Glucose-6-phosphate 1-dehydrogenase n=1 Tax=Megalodesulfovibrio gigas (strain ATCC 19364 / DSM 1382 / NCIMB 9332 / VKM B-1759) TaxID=1121448 RepID=T2GAT2_MEGG1|nr:glucose-6-phosphate dehydrogenase [Megalodesulfovibrio gigas]AGW13231.1 putative glucose-6-phosphate 1-dehydrogenase [Megalodesulfovibrio gigas DSM 1382 = ATCC 19364]